MRYAVLGYRTINIGDDIQSFITSTLLDISFIIMRDNYEEIYDMEGNRTELNESVKLIMNGWFMHNYDWKTGNDNIKFPIKNKNIIPVYISTCLSKDVPLLYSDVCIEHYKKYEPILCRDLTTFKMLKDKGVTVEFYGCLTQLLDVEKLPENNEYKNKYENSTIYIDCPEEYKKRNKKEKSFFFKHYIEDIINMNPKNRLDYAKDLLIKYKYAKKIYSHRLHAFLPCRAMGLDVKYVGDMNYRVKDLILTLPDKIKLQNIFNNKIND